MHSLYSILGLCCSVSIEPVLCSVNVNDERAVGGAWQNQSCLIFLIYLFGVPRFENKEQTNRLAKQEKT